MQAIFSCKMYKASKNKDGIKAALSDPINTELVQQLRSYLDEEFKDEAIREDSPKKAENIEAEPVESPQEDSTSMRPSKHTSHPAPSHMDHHLSDELNEGLDSESLEPADTDTRPEDDNSEEPVGEATQVSSSAVLGSTSCPECSIVDQANSIKGILNSQDTTCGVVRIIVKEQELWIHYNDDTNLNNVMEPVIETLNAASYSNLQFNRLARTENAIVFSISVVPQPVEPVKESKDE